MQTNVILTGSAVPNADSAFSAPLQITPNVHLVIAWSPVVRDADFRRALEIGLAKGSDGFFLARGRLTRLCGRSRPCLPRRLISAALVRIATDARLALALQRRVLVDNRLVDNRRVPKTGHASSSRV